MPPSTIDITGTLAELCERGLGETESAYVADLEPDERDEALREVRALKKHVSTVVGRTLQAFPKGHDRTEASELLLSVMMPPDAADGPDNEPDAAALIREIGAERTAIELLLRIVTLMERSKEIDCVDEILQTEHTVTVPVDGQQADRGPRLDRTLTVL